MLAPADRTISSDSRLGRNTQSVQPALSPSSAAWRCIDFAPLATSEWLRASRFIDADERVLTGQRLGEQGRNHDPVKCRTPLMSGGKAAMCRRGSDLHGLKMPPVTPCAP